MSDEQSDHDEVIARANKHIDARLHDMEIGGRVGDSAEGGLAMEFGYYRDSCQMFYINGRDDMKAVMQPEIDTLRTEVAYYDSALRKIRELTKGVIYSADSKFADIAEIANAARGGIVSEPTPGPPENLKALREAKNLSVEYVNHHLHRTGLVADIEDYEDGDGRFCNDSPISFVLAHIFGIAEPRVFAAHKQSVAEREVLGES